MSILDRSELESSSLADLHAIANQMGIDGFRRMQRAELIDALAGAGSGGGSEEAGEGPREVAGSEEGAAERDEEGAERDEEGAEREEERAEREEERAEREEEGATPRRSRAEREEQRGERAAPRQGRGERDPAPRERTAEGVVKLLDNGSAFLRWEGGEGEDDDVYISAAQVRRCELVDGDRVSGPLRLPRRSERHPSLVRIDTINGETADAVAGGARYESLPVEYPRERFALASEDPTLRAIESLTPFGRGSRVVISGPARAGKSETLRRLIALLRGAGDELEIIVVLDGVRPEEISAWAQGGAPEPWAAHSFAESAETQGRAAERAAERGRRVAARGGHAIVAIDTLDGVHPHVARKVLAAARKLVGGGSLTVIATATRPLGGETTVIALDTALTSTGRVPLDLAHSGTVRPELLVGEEGAEAIQRARLAAEGAPDAQRR